MSVYKRCWPKMHFWSVQHSVADKTCLSVAVSLSCRSLKPRAIYFPVNSIFSLVLWGETKRLQPTLTLCLTFHLLGKGQQGGADLSSLKRGLLCGIM